MATFFCLSSIKKKFHFLVLYNKRDEPRAFPPSLRSPPTLLRKGTLLTERREQKVIAQITIHSNDLDLIGIGRSECIQVY